MGLQEIRYMTKVHRLGLGLQKALSARNIEIAFKEIHADKGETYVFYRVGSVGLPPNIHPEDLSGADTEQFLTIAIGYPVKAINGSGLTYCIKLSDSANKF
jgi:hypothetical protein